MNSKTRALFLWGIAVMLFLFLSGIAIQLDNTTQRIVIISLGTVVLFGVTAYISKDLGD